MLFSVLARFADINIVLCKNWIFMVNFLHYLNKKRVSIEVFVGRISIHAPEERPFQLVSLDQLCPGGDAFTAIWATSRSAPTLSLCSLRAPAPHHPHPHRTELKIARNLSDSPSPHVKPLLTHVLHLSMSDENSTMKSCLPGDPDVFHAALLLWLRGWNGFWTIISASRFAALPHIFFWRSCMCDSLRHHLSCCQLTDGGRWKTVLESIYRSVGTSGALQTFYSKLLFIFYSWATTLMIYEIIQVNSVPSAPHAGKV